MVVLEKREIFVQRGKEDMLHHSRRAPIFACFRGWDFRQISLRIGRKVACLVC